MSGQASEERDGSGEFEPDDGFAREPTKRTDEPLTERLLGPQGVRLLHIVGYTCIFLVVVAISDMVYAGLFTLAWGMLHILELSPDTVQSVLTQQFWAFAFSAASIILAMVTAAGVTYLVYSVNERRWSRGEWIRTFL